MKANISPSKKQPAKAASRSKSAVSPVSKEPKTAGQTVGAKAVSKRKAPRNPVVNPAKATSSGAGAKKFLQSSLGAITRSRDDATEAVAEGLGRFAESIGLRKLEDVFDERVASALERMGIPTARELARLRERVEKLSLQVDELMSRSKK